MGTVIKTEAKEFRPKLGAYEVCGCEVEFPNVKEKQDLDQDEEWFWLDTGDGRERVRFHDYEKIYDVPGLYEHIFYEWLCCVSPQTVCSLLAEEIDGTGDMDASDLRVLDVGAGNGIVGEVLEEIKVDEVVGVDIIPEAEEAALRDRDSAYDDFHTVDLTAMPDEVRKDLVERDLNCAITVAALGFGDMPPLAFAEAFNLIDTPGWVAFNIKEDFVQSKDSSGFSELIRQLMKHDLIELRRQKRYRHRYSQAGEPLYYHAMVGKKLGDIPGEWLEQLQ